MAEKRVIELDIQTNEKSLKAQLKEAQAEVQKLADKFGATSQEAVNAAKKAAQLKDAIGDAASLTDSFNPDAKFNALSKSIGGVLDGFQAFEGALGLVGVEGEAVQETMLKVQSAMALSQGLQGLGEARDSFKQLGAVAMNALKGIRTGLAATGIGLFVVALGLVVAYWDDIKTAVSGVSSEQQKLNELSHKNFETSKEQLSNLDAQDNVLKLQGKSEREILNLKIAKVNTAIELGKIELTNILLTSKAEEAAAIQNYNMTKKVVDFILDTALFLPKLMLLPIDMAIKGANKVSEALGFGKLIAFDMGKTMEDMQSKLSGFVAGSIFNVPELKKENKLAAEEIEKSISDLTNQQAGFKLSIKEIDKAAAQTAIDANKEKNDLINNADAEAARLAIEQQNELNKRLEDLAEQNFQNTLTEQEREILLVNDKYFELETLADGNKEALAQIELAKANELNDINLKYQGIAYENDKVAKEKKAVLDKEAAAKEIENAKAVAEQKAALQQQGLDTALQGVQLIKNVFENQKGVQKAAVIAESAIGIAKMIIANKLANAGALATPQAIATSGAAAAPVIALNNISTGIGIAANIAATAKALKTLGGGSAPTAPASGGDGGGGGAISPNFNVIGSSGVNQLAQIQQQPTRAYVVSGDVATGLSLERNRLQNASF